MVQIQEPLNDVNEMTFSNVGAEEDFAMGEAINLGDGSGDVEEHY